MSTPASQFVQLGSKKGPEQAPVKRGFGPIADKFFSSGALAIFFGTAWVGAHLWLMSFGQMTRSEFYVELTKFHYLLQIYGFFGLFMLGFLVQAAPKLLDVKMPPSPKMLFIIPAMIIGLVVWFYYPETNLGQCVVSLCFLAALGYLANVFRQSEAESKTFVGIMLVLGLGTFAASPFFNLAIPLNALVFFWLSVASVILTAGRQFIRSTVPDITYDKKSSMLFLLLYLLSAATLIGAAHVPGNEIFQLWGIAGVITLLVYTAATRLWRLFPLVLKAPLAMAFCCSYFWAFVGAIWLSVHGAAAADFVFHIWATGWGATMILGVSSQIIGHLSGKGPLFSNRFMLLLLAAWQLVPLGRGILLSPVFAWISSTAAGVVIVVWAAKLLWVESKVLRMQSQLWFGK